MKYVNEKVSHGNVMITSNGCCISGGSFLSIGDRSVYSFLAEKGGQIVVVGENNI